MNEYKYKIDKDLLSDFYLHYEESSQKQIALQVAELNKVITVVFIKHYSSYVSDEDLRSAALLAIFERRTKYDPSFSAYNYTYAIVRNEIGNTIKKYGREVFTDDIVKYDNRVYVSPLDEIPEEVRRYSEYLTGQKPFTFFRIPQSDVLNLLLFLRMNDSTSIKKAPDFVRDDIRSIDLMYKLLQDCFKNG